MSLPKDIELTEKQREAAEELHSALAGDYESPKSEDAARRIVAALYATTDFGVDDDLATHYADFYANLLHFQRQARISVGDVRHAALTHYEAEVAEEDSR